MSRSDDVWKSAELSESFLQGVRGAIPLASAQIDVMLRLVRGLVPDVRTFLDLGCGDGVLGRAILEGWPKARGLFVDFSDAMLRAARTQIPDPNRADFLSLDFGDPGWTGAAQPSGPFDLVLSGFAIHHQPDDRKRAIFREVFDLLAPGALFLNLEHVASPSLKIESIFEDLFIDSLYHFHRARGSGRSRDDLAREYYHRPDKAANILADVFDQCRWLREIGFVEVDCYFKILELALFGGVRSR